MPRLGILGGGQLARMTIQAAIPFGIDIAILADAADSPAGRLARDEIAGSWNDEVTLRRFAELVDVVTLENEFVDAAILERLAAWGKLVRPGAATLRKIQDKLLQKETLAAHRLPVPAFAAVEQVDDIARFAEQHGWPLVLKARRNGYDGYGNAAVANLAECESALAKLGWPQRTVMVEEFVRFQRELAVLIVRSVHGEALAYPVVETIQHDHVCHVVRAPAPVSSRIAEEATSIALAAVEAVEGIGITAVEMFVSDDDRVIVNELAPRPHNSGHYSIEACHTSQFENHLRAVLGWPLGNPSMRVPAAVMVNMLGSRDGTVHADGFQSIAPAGDARVHLYGKREVRRRRKMGHVTVTGSNLQGLEQQARDVVQRFGL